MIAALIEGKIKKEKELQQQALREKELANRQAATRQWDFSVIQTFMGARSKEIFKYDFVIDENNEDVFNLLCYYFIGDEDGFLKQARKFESLENPSINKGILLCGNFGTGKTDMMRLFQKNNRQVYYTRSAKNIANEFLRSKEKDIPSEYLEPFKLAINDPVTMFQPIAGLCIDDFGRESEKNNFGNKSNVIGDLIELRYADKWTGVFLHGTTNLSATELANHYGEAVVSRKRQIFNFIELPGDDRRK